MRSIVSGSGGAPPVGCKGEALPVGDARRRDKRVKTAKQALQSPNLAGGLMLDLPQGRVLAPVEGKLGD